MMLFDTHAHYYDAKFDCDRDEVLSSMKENGVGYILNAGCDVVTTQKCIELAEKYERILIVGHSMGTLLAIENAVRLLTLCGAGHII